MHSTDNCRLFFKSKNFCSVPWNHFAIFTDGSISTCTKGKKIKNINDVDLIDFLQYNNYLKNVKIDLFNDIPNKNCTACNSLENNNYAFLRDLYNPKFIKSEVNYRDTKSFTLLGADLHWGSTCQLKCITCWDKQSSSIAKEENKPILTVSNENADKVITEIVKSQHQLKELYLSGGEPTLINHNYRLLKKLNENKLPDDCEIRINTNMMFDDDNKIINELKRFPNVLFTISADNTFEKFEYIRRGASWNKFIENLSNLQKTHFKWRLNSVFFVASAYDLANTQNFFIDNFGINDFTINQVGMGKTSIRCRNLPNEVSNKCKDRITEHQLKNASNDNLKGQLDNCLKELSHEQEESYIPFFERIDKLEKSNWKETFKELCV